MNNQFEINIGNPQTLERVKLSNLNEQNDQITKSQPYPSIFVVHLASKNMIPPTITLSFGSHTLLL